MYNSLILEFIYRKLVKRKQNVFNSKNLINILSKYRNGRNGRKKQQNISHFTFIIIFIYSANLFFNHKNKVDLCRKILIYEKSSPIRSFFRILKTEIIVSAIQA